MVSELVGVSGASQMSEHDRKIVYLCKPEPGASMKFLSGFLTICWQGVKK